jgi:hypothetical protein
MCVGESLLSQLSPFLFTTRQSNQSKKGFPSEVVVGRRRNLAFRGSRRVGQPRREPELGPVAHYVMSIWINSVASGIREITS